VAIHIRAATADDLPGILSIYNDAVLTTTAIWNETEVDLENRRAWLIERQSAGFPVLVAAEVGDVLGYATFGPFRPHDGYRHTVENSIYVRNDQRGRGIGAQMMPVLIDAARHGGKHAIIAGIEANNEASLKLHARFGFREVARMPQVGRKFDRWLDLVLMQRLLGERM
jgi:phosphinothricin acetyltransferase